jgi:hypothetical protein
VVGPISPIPAAAPVAATPLPTIPNAGANGRRGKRELLPVAYKPTDIVTYVAPNEKRIGTDAHAHYAYYQAGLPVHTYLYDRRMPKGQGARCLAWDIARGLVRVTPVDQMDGATVTDLRS